MSDAQDLHVLATRIASFDSVKPKGKKRASTAKNKKPAHYFWHCQQPSIEQLAEAGFYYSPTDVSPDNVKCFHCEKNLDQWEEGDDAVREHLEAAPECAWAVITAIETRVTPVDDDHDPLAESFLEARKATFGTSWPHEKKAGWAAKVQKLVEAGWHYLPSADSRDYTSCAYCGLGLDGWEPKDKPVDEHRRRKPHCPFFALADLHKKTRISKKARASKGSRASVQSTISTAHDLSTDLDDSARADDSILTTATDLTTASTASTGTKKGGRTKKSAAKPGTRSTRGRKVEETTETEAETAEGIVTEDLPHTQQSKRGKKRSTMDMQAEQAEEELTAPRKKRATRSRATATQAPEDDSQNLPGDSIVSDVEPDVVAVPKRGAKVRSARSSTASRATSRKASGTRKPSGKKTTVATIAVVSAERQQSLDDGEIDAMLEADLERQVSEDELLDAGLRADPSPEPTTKSKTQKATKTKVSKKPKPTASSRKASAASFDALRSDDNEASAHNTGDLFRNPYEDLNAQSGDEMSEMPAQKSPVLGKKPVAKSRAPRAKKAGKSKAAVSSVIQRGSPQENGDDQPSNLDRQRVTEPTEARFSSSFEHEPSVLEEIEVPAEIVEHFSPKKKSMNAAPAKVAKSTKAGKTVKKSQAKMVTALIRQQNERSEEDNKGPLEAENLANGTGQSSPLPAKSTKVPIARSPIHTTPGGFPSPTPSPQSSNAENEQPSVRPSQKRPPLLPLTPSQVKTRIPLAEASTPTRSIRKERADESISPQWALNSSFPWRPVDLETVFLGSPRKATTWFGLSDRGKHSLSQAKPDVKQMQSLLTSPEKNMTVEDWITHNADKGEQNLKSECERVVGEFESQGVRALKALEGLEVQE